MRREMDEAYIWSASQTRADRGLIEDVSPWQEGETVDLAADTADLLARIAALEAKVVIR